MDYIKIINEDLSLEVGLGATQAVGSDRYPFYIAELCKNGAIGLYVPEAHFKHDWTEGSQEVAKFDPSKTATQFIRKSYGHWWECERNGKRIRRFNGYLKFGQACSYLDPEF